MVPILQIWKSRYVSYEGPHNSHRTELAPEPMALGAQGALPTPLRGSTLNPGKVKLISSQKP